MTFLVAYASTHGHTAHIAERIAGVLGDAGIAADLYDLRVAGAPAVATTSASWSPGPGGTPSAWASCAARAFRSA